MARALWKRKKNLNLKRNHSVIRLSKRTLAIGQIPHIAALVREDVGDVKTTFKGIRYYLTGNQRRMLSSALLDLTKAASKIESLLKKHE